MIRKSPIFLQLIQELIASDALKTLAREFQKGEHLITQGSAIQDVFVIRQGLIKCFISEDNGKEYILEFLGEGEVLGEIEAIKRIPCISTVEALTPTSVYKIDISTFTHLLQKEQKLNWAVVDLMATRLANTAIRSSRQQLYSLSHTLANLMEVLDSGKIPFTKQDLSAYLGISVRSLNRLLREMGG